MGYVVSSGGTFGVEQRRFRSVLGVEMVVIRWGTLGWVTSVPASEVTKLRSQFESEARQEAERLLGK